MRSRPAPTSLVWLAVLVALAIGTALIAGATIYLQTRAAGETQARAMTGGNVRAGRSAMQRYACGGCHVIPGIAGAVGKVGPDLTHVGRRPFIAGRLANSPEAMVRWITRPQQVSPGNAMPDQGVTERDARDMAAYLYARR